MGPSFLQILLILMLVLILFGAGKLPRVMGDIGKGVRSMRDGLKGEDEEKAAAKRLAEEPKDVTPPAAERQKQEQK